MKKMTAKVDIVPVSDGPVSGFSTLLPASERSSARKRGMPHTNRESYNDIVSTLFEHNTEVMEELLIKSAKCGDLAQVALILQRRAEVLFNIDAKDRASGNTALMWAATNGHSKIVQLLLRHAADVTVKNHDGVTAIGLSLPLVRQMLLDSVEHGGTHNSLCQAAWQGNAPLTKKLLAQNSVNVNCKNADKLNPILLATRDIHLFEKLGSFALGGNYSPLEVIKELLRHNIDLTAADESQMTALHYICCSGSQCSSQIVPCLLRAGANPDARDKTSSTPLHYASKKGNSDILVELLNSGADPNAKDCLGTTPLHLTARYGHDQATLALVQHGADIFVADEDGLTPLDVAKNKAVKLTLRQAWMSSSRKPVDFELVHEANSKNEPTCDATSNINAKQSKEGNPVISNPNYSRHLKGNVVGFQPSELKGDQQHHGSTRIKFGGKGMASRPTPRSPQSQRRAPCRVNHPEKTDEKCEDLQKQLGSQYDHFLPRLSRSPPMPATATSGQESFHLRSSEEKLLTFEDLFPDVTDDKTAIGGKPGSAKFPKQNSCPTISQVAGNTSPLGSNQSPRNSEGNCFSPHYIPQLASIFFNDVDRIYRNACQHREDNMLKVVEIDSSSVEDQCNSSAVNSPLHSKAFKSILREGNFNIDDTRVRKSDDSGCPDESTANYESTSSSNSNISSSLEIQDLPNSGQKSSRSKDVTKKTVRLGSSSNPMSSSTSADVGFAKMSLTSVNVSNDASSNIDVKMMHCKTFGPKEADLVLKETENPAPFQNNGKANVLRVKPPQTGILVKPVANSFITNNKNTDLKVKPDSQTSASKTSSNILCTSSETPLNQQSNGLDVNATVGVRTENRQVRNNTDGSKINESAKISNPLTTEEQGPCAVKDCRQILTKADNKTRDLKPLEAKSKTKTKVTEISTNTRSPRSFSCGPLERVQPSALLNKNAETGRVDGSLPKKTMVNHCSIRTLTKSEQINDGKSKTSEQESAATENVIGNSAVVITRNRPSSFHLLSSVVDDRGNTEVAKRKILVSELSGKVGKTFTARPILPEKPALLDENSISKTQLPTTEAAAVTQVSSSAKPSMNDSPAPKSSLSKTMASPQKQPVSHNQPSTRKALYGQRNPSETTEFNSKESSKKSEFLVKSSVRTASSSSDIDQTKPCLQHAKDTATKTEGQNKVPFQTKAVAFVKQIRSSFRNSSHDKVDPLRQNVPDKNAEMKIDKTTKEYELSSDKQNKLSARVSTPGDGKNNMPGPKFEDGPDNKCTPEVPSKGSFVNNCSELKKKTDDEVTYPNGFSKLIHQIPIQMLASKPAPAEYTGPIVCDAFESLKLKQAAESAVSKDEGKSDMPKVSTKSAVKARCKTATMVNRHIQGKSKTPKSARRPLTSAGMSSTKIKSKPGRKERGRTRTKRHSTETSTSWSKEDDFPSGPDVKLIGGIGWHVATRSIEAGSRRADCQEVDYLEVSGDQEEILENICATSRSTARKSTRTDRGGSETKLHGLDSIDHVDSSAKKIKNRTETRHDSNEQSVIMMSSKHGGRNLDKEPASTRQSGRKYSSRLSKESVISQKEAQNELDSGIILRDTLNTSIDEDDKEVTITVFPMTPRKKSSPRSEDSGLKLPKNSQDLQTVRQSKVYDDRPAKVETELKDQSKRNVKASDKSSHPTSSKQSKLKSEEKGESVAQKHSKVSLAENVDLSRSQDRGVNVQTADEHMHENSDSLAVKVDSTHIDTPEYLLGDNEQGNTLYDSIATVKISKSASSGAISQSFDRSPRFIRKHDSYTLRQRATAHSSNDNEDSRQEFSAQLSSDMQQLENSLISSDQNDKIVTSRLGRCSAYSHSGSSNSRTQVIMEDVETIQWKRGNVLGKGAYGTVWCGLTNSGELIAVKMIELNKSNFEKAEMEYAQIQDEVELLKTLKHKNIVGYLGTSLEDNYVSIFMQFVPGGSIASIIARFGSLDEEVFCNYTKQILEGVEYLHANNVIHRDVKGGNIMLMHNGIIKLIDFGCAKKLCFNITTPSTDLSPLLKSMRGTPYWMAPEVVREDGHGIQSDIWSIGCTVFEMATKKPPWSEYPPAVAIFTIGCDSKPIPQLPSKFTENARSFVNACLTRNPNERPSATELLRHAFVVNRRRPKASSLS